MHTFKPFVVDVAHLMTSPMLFSLQNDSMRTVRHRSVVPIGSPIVIPISTGTLDKPCMLLQLMEKI